MSHTEDWEELIKKALSSEKTLKPTEFDTITGSIKNRLHQMQKNNVTLSAIDKNDLEELLSLLNRQNTLIAVFEHITDTTTVNLAKVFDLSDLSMTYCEYTHCDYIQSCIFNSGKVDDCQEKMAVMNKNN